MEVSSWTSSIFSTASRLPRSPIEVLMSIRALCPGSHLSIQTQNHFIPSR